jgi:8-oxo-dGTP diphosphatase
MPSAYTIATLLYFFNQRDEVLLQQRSHEPNRGFWSPCGGKLDTKMGESPYSCACREAREEVGLTIHPKDLHLTGIISEHGDQRHGHWLMFLFESRSHLTRLPSPSREGHFQFFPQNALLGLRLPQTDREQIWPLFWRHRHGFFAAHCHSHPDGQNEWIIEESADD